MDWFSQMATHADDKVAAAYKAHYGKELKTDEDSATAAWVKALAANSPLLTDADEAAAQAVGAPGQKEPFIGLVSSAKFRNNIDSGSKLGLCTGLQPFAGWMYPSLGLIAKGTDSPNAARLFVRYLLTEEGIAPQAVDGKISTNKDAKLPADEPSGIGKALDQILPYAAATATKRRAARCRRRRARAPPRCVRGAGRAPRGPARGSRRSPGSAVPAAPDGSPPTTPARS